MSSMKITKYPQSCLLIEKAGKRLLIDPGIFVAQKYAASEFGSVDAVLITHERADHLHTDLLQAVIGGRDISVIANESAAALSKGLVTQTVHDGDTFTVAGFDVVAHELPHCAMVDGSAGPQNTGYIIDGAFFDPGDGVEVTGVQVPTAGVAIAGPDISPRDVVTFIKSVGCKTVIPLHYTNDVFHGLKESAVTWAEWGGLTDVRVVPLADGESVEV